MTTPTRTLIRPAAQNLSLSLVEHPSFQFSTSYTPSTSSDDNCTVQSQSSVYSCLDRESVSSVIPWKSSGRRTLPSALTTGSVYSQESCTYQTTPVCAKSRRFGIVLESSDVDELWPLATSPLSPSTGAFILNLRNADEPQESTPQSVNFVALSASYLVTSPKTPDATMVVLDGMTHFQITAGEQNSFLPSLDPTRGTVVASPTPANEVDTAPGISETILESEVEPGNGKMSLPTRGLGGLLSRISLPTTKRHTSAMDAISGILEESAEKVSMVEHRATTAPGKRQRTLRKRVPSTWKQAFGVQQTSVLSQGSSTVSTQKSPIPPLPAISISPLAVSFERAKDNISEHDLDTDILDDDWETIGIAI